MFDDDKISMAVFPSSLLVWCHFFVPNHFWQFKTVVWTIGLVASSHSGQKVKTGFLDSMGLLKSGKNSTYVLASIP